MLVKKTTVVPIECVVRGYLAGSAWKEYRQTGAVCGIALPPGLRESERLPEPIFTPATKEESGHDINISFQQMADLVGQSTADELRRRSLEIYQKAANLARTRGILIADTKFEWGRLPSGEIILIDEVLTPDSSRFWPADGYAPGGSQPSYDKTVRSRLVGTKRLGQKQPAAATSRRRGGTHLAKNISKHLNDSPAGRIDLHLSHRDTEVTVKGKRQFHFSSVFLCDLCDSVVNHRIFANECRQFVRF